MAKFGPKLLKPTSLVELVFRPKTGTTALRGSIPISPVLPDQEESLPMDTTSAEKLGAFLRHQAHLQSRNP